MLLCYYLLLLRYNGHVFSDTKSVLRMRARFHPTPSVVSRYVLKTKRRCARPWFLYQNVVTPRRVFLCAVPGSRSTQEMRRASCPVQINRRCDVACDTMLVTRVAVLGNTVAVPIDLCTYSTPDVPHVNPASVLTTLVHVLRVSKSHGPVYHHVVLLPDPSNMCSRVPVRTCKVLKRVCRDGKQWEADGVKDEAIAMARLCFLRLAVLQLHLLFTTDSAYLSLVQFASCGVRSRGRDGQTQRGRVRKPSPKQGAGMHEKSFPWGRHRTSMRTADKPMGWRPAWVLLPDSPPPPSCSSLPWCRLRERQCMQK